MMLGVICAGLYWDPVAGCMCHKINLNTTRNKMYRLLLPFPQTGKSAGGKVCPMFCPSCASFHMGMT